MCYTVSLAQADSVGIRKSGNTVSPVSSNNFKTDTLGLHPDSNFIVRKIKFVGNKKTRDIILIRELPFKQGDTIHTDDLPALLEKGKVQLNNTSLFHSDSVTLYVSDYEYPYIDVTIKVKERWYILALPYFKPVDRNLNEWLFEKGASISRIDYGVKLAYDNITGNRDKFRFYFITGYTRQLSLSYSRPFIDKNLKWGFSTNVAIGKNHEVLYNTIADQQEFLKTDDYLKNFLTAEVNFTYRPAFYTTHTFGIGYNNIRFGDSLFILNPDYFKNDKHHLKYAELSYALDYKNVDYIPYPTKGYVASVRFTKLGLNSDLNTWELTAKGIGYWHIGEKAFYSIGASGTIKAPFKQPYYTSRLLGYGDMFMRGYEYYVVDGVAGGYLQAELGRQIANFKIHIPAFKWLLPRLIPLKIYGKVFGNSGYVYNPDRNPTNRLPNHWLNGGGIGLDIVTDYDFTLKLEFSFNHLGENGIYLQKKDLF